MSEEGPPAQQRAVPYSKYFKCETEAMMLAKAMGIDFTSLRFVSSRVAPRQNRVKVSGTHLRVLATVVWMTLSVVEGGKRTNLPPNSPNYFARVDGKWRYIDDQIGNFLKPNCGS